MPSSFICTLTKPALNTGICMHDGIVYISFVLYRCLLSLAIIIAELDFVYLSHAVIGGPSIHCRPSNSGTSTILSTDYR